MDHVRNRKRPVFYGTLAGEDALDKAIDDSQRSWGSYAPALPEKQLSMRKRLKETSENGFDEGEMPIVGAPRSPLKFKIRVNTRDVPHYLPKKVCDTIFRENPNLPRQEAVRAHVDQTWHARSGDDDEAKRLYIENALIRKSFAKIVNEENDDDDSSDEDDDED